MAAVRQRERMGRWGFANIFSSSIFVFRVQSRKTGLPRVCRVPARLPCGNALVTLRSIFSDAHGPGHPLLGFAQFTLCRQKKLIGFDSPLRGELCEALNLQPSSFSCKLFTAQRRGRRDRAGWTGCGNQSRNILMDSPQLFKPCIRLTVREIDFSTPQRRGTPLETGHSGAGGTARH